jgi:hypothetical protein
MSASARGQLRDRLLFLRSIPSAVRVMAARGYVGRPSPVQFSRERNDFVAHSTQSGQ